MPRETFGKFFLIRVSVDGKAIPSLGRWAVTPSMADTLAREWSECGFTVEVFTVESYELLPADLS